MVIAEAGCLFLVDADGGCQCWLLVDTYCSCWWSLMFEVNGGCCRLLILVVHFQREEHMIHLTRSSVRKVA